MRAEEFIKEKMINWALNRGLKLQGSEGERGEKTYTMTLEENLFEPLISKVKEQFNEGKGRELKGNPCPMQAVHSSAALVVNIFQYWMEDNKNRNFSPIIESLGFSEIAGNSWECEFEKKFSICRGTPPHLDVLFSCKDKEIVIAIESKFSEPYSSRGKIEEMQDAYFKENLFPLWEDMPHVKELAEKIRTGKETDFNQHLHVSQLIKHVLGLKKKYKKSDFYLVYLWYNVPGGEGYIHQKEIEDLKKVFKEDGINFLSLTYQELIINLAKNFRREHPEYIKYITERYL